jgi:hypothetical protein
MWVVIGIGISIAGVLVAPSVAEQLIALNRRVASALGQLSAVVPEANARLDRFRPVLPRFRIHRLGIAIAATLALVLLFLWARKSWERALTCGAAAAIFLPATLLMSMGRPLPSGPRKTACEVLWGLLFVLPLGWLLGNAVGGRWPGSATLAGGLAAVLAVVSWLEMGLLIWRLGTFVALMLTWGLCLPVYLGARSLQLIGGLAWVLLALPLLLHRLLQRWLRWLEERSNRLHIDPERQQLRRISIKEE